jgi:RiboL-PSP-HEPN
MHSPDDVFEDLEGDRRTREAEIRLFERLITLAENQNEKDMLRRCIILLTYAHLEGFCRFALQAYAAALNALRLRCVDASYPIAAAGLAKVFAALRDPQSKHEAFRRTLPDDTQLHLAAREQAFIERYENISASTVEISDDVIDTKSNLSPVVLKKMLFQLGLSYPAVEGHSGNIYKLLNIRNAIAHGDRLRIPSEEVVGSCVTAMLDVMAFLQDEVFNALKSELYRRAVRPPQPRQPEGQAN